MHIKFQLKLFRSINIHEIPLNSQASFKCLIANAQSFTSWFCLLFRMEFTKLTFNEPNFLCNLIRFYSVFLQLCDTDNVYLQGGATPVDGPSVPPPPSNSNQWLCPLCNQGFSLHDRLAKHMASRHKEWQNVN